METIEILGAYVNCTKKTASHVERLAKNCEISLIEGRTYTAEFRQVWDEHYDGAMVSQGPMLVIRDEYTKTEKAIKL